MEPDIYIKVRFRTTSEDGRKTSVSGDFYACPLIIDDKAYDCRLLIKGMTLELGCYYEVPVKFLNKDLIVPNLVIGKHVILWEGKEIANGQVTRICL